MDALSMYAQVLGPTFTDLAPALKRLHGSEHRRFTGILTVQTGAHPLARLSLWLARLPRAQGDAPCRLCLLPSKSGELWQRYLGPWKFITHQSLAGNPGTHESKNEIRERFGAITLRLRLRIKGQGLSIRSVETRILGIPVPRSFGIRVVAYEKPAGNNSFYCNVRVYMPGLGMLLQYRGTLSQSQQKTAYVA
jgi:hypothetical protein